MNKKPYYITTAIAYTSGKPHIGNTYEIVLADSIARFMRKTGYDVYFQTGTDEHGQKIQIKAEEAGKTPQQFVDEVACEIKYIWDMMNTSYDKFVRTTDKKHELSVQKIFKKLYDKGDIYKGEYEGWYCTPCESFLTETQLNDGKCPDCGREVQKSREEAYFFKLSKYQERLVSHIKDNPEFIQPESRKNEMINNFLKPGLQDLCVSRTSFNWGVPVSFDDKHVTYVWIDALSNYITGLGYDSDGNHSDMFLKYWPANVHLIGKDILRFHTIYWPILLMALDIKLPKQVFGHPWLLVGDSKMSKSKGNVIYPDYLVKHFGVDAVRYYVLHEMPFAQDGTITYELIIERINSDLANILGNLVNRTISMQKKYFNGEIKAPEIKEEIDEKLINIAMATSLKVQNKMKDLKVADAIDEIFILLRRSNKYIDETMPWILGKSEETKPRLATVMYNLLESIRIAGVLLHSFIPQTAEKIFKQLNTDKKDWNTLTKFGQLKPGDFVGEPEILFARIDTVKKLKEMEADTKPKIIETKKKDKKTEQVSIEDFAKLEFKTAKVIKAEKIEGTKKLLKLTVSLGDETRQVVSGIANHYTPMSIEGKTVVLVTNLKPVKLKGVLSEGMILAAANNKDLSIVTIDKNMPEGTKIS